MNKLFGASVVVLALAATPVFADQTDDSGASADAGAVAVATQVELLSRNMNNSNNDSSVEVDVKDNETNLLSKNSIDRHDDNSVNVHIDDIRLSYETNAAVSYAELHNTSTNNKVAIASGLAFFNDVKTSAKMGDGANSHWSGLNQVNISAGSNGNTQMNQQVSANVRNLTMY